MQDLVETLSALLAGKKYILATAESCTGGMIAAAITARPGSSSILECGFVTYSNQSKTNMLGVPASLIEQHGAVSAEVAEAMVKGAIKNSGAKIGISVTGIAGPSGGTAEKPVGTVYIGYGIENEIKGARHLFKGDRASIREQTAIAALQHLIEYLS